MSPDRPAFELPTTGPDVLPWDTALAAVLGYARGRRPLRYRSPIERDGRWVQVPAFGYERFDRRPVPDGRLGDDDVLVGEEMHGRLEPDGWAGVPPTSGPRSAGPSTRSSPTTTPSPRAPAAGRWPSCRTTSSRCSASPARSAPRSGPWASRPGRTPATWWPRCTVAVRTWCRWSPAPP